MWKRATEDSQLTQIRQWCKRKKLLLLFSATDCCGLLVVAANLTNTVLSPILLSRDSKLLTFFSTPLTSPTPGKGLPLIILELYWGITHIKQNPPIKTYISMVFSIFTELNNHHHNAILEHFITPKRNPILICSHFLFPPPFNTRKTLTCIMSW